MDHVKIPTGKMARDGALSAPLALALMTTAFLPACVFAQEVPQQGGDQLEEIIVTAQRRSENLQQTPVSITALGESALRDRGIDNLQELSRVEPSLSIPSGPGVFLPFLRGIGNSAAGTVGNESSVPVYIDDVYYSRLSTAFLAINSIERVEILKGPQGTLFGRNSSGGAIQMFTKNPGSEPELMATIGYGNYDTVNAQLYAAMPVTENLGWNISAALNDQRNGWGHSLATGDKAHIQKLSTIRSNFVWEPGPETQIKVAGFYARTRGNIGIAMDRHSGTFGATPGLPGYPNPPVILPSLADVPGGNFYNTRLNTTPMLTETGYGGSFKLTQGFEFADAVSITAFRRAHGVFRNDSDLGPFNLTNPELNYFDRQFTQEFQLKSRSDSKVAWNLGAFYMRSRAGYDPARVTGDLVNIVIAPGASQNIFSDQVINSFSIYGQTTVPLSSRTNLTAGLRYTNDKLVGNGYTTASIPGRPDLPLSAPYNSTARFERLTWRGAIDHRLSDDLMIFGSISRGYKAGTFNTLPLDSPVARPETVDAYEIGLKSEFLDRRVRLNAALFWNDIGNPQVLTIIPKGITSGIGLTNAEKAQVKGAELGLEVRAAQGLTLRGSVSYLDGKFLKFARAPFYSQGTTTIVGPVIGDASGNRLPTVPRWRMDGGVNYAMDTAGGRFVADVGLSYTGRFAWNADNFVWEKPVTLLNASLSYSPSSARWLTFGLWGKNLTNVQYYANTQENAGSLGSGAFQTIAAPPRTYGGTVSVSFP